jgi:hypothetical protein
MINLSISRVSEKLKMNLSRREERNELTMKRTRILIPVFIAVVLAGAAMPAPAAMESFLVDYGSASAPLMVGDSSTVNLPQFNPSQGTLTDVSV